MKLLLFLSLLFCTMPYLAHGDEQPPYKISDAAVDENFTRVYYLTDQHKHTGNDGSSRLQTVIPSSGSTYDLGSTTSPWKNLYVNNLFVTSGIQITGGNTNYIQNTGTLQTGATFFVSSGSVTSLNVSSINVTNNLQIGKTNIFSSSWTVNAFNGYVQYYTTGTIPNNTSITIAASQFSGSAIGAPSCGMIEVNNTAANTVRVKSLSNLPASFTVYNSDAINVQAFWCQFLVKPN